MKLKKKAAEIKQKALEVIKGESGQGMVEYALIIALIAVAVIGTITLLGDQIENLLQAIIDTIGGVDGVDPAGP